MVLGLLYVGVGLLFTQLQLWLFVTAVIAYGLLLWTAAALLRAVSRAGPALHVLGHLLGIGHAIFILQQGRPEKVIPLGILAAHVAALTLILHASVQTFFGEVRAAREEAADETPIR